MPLYNARTPVGNTSNVIYVHGQNNSPYKLRNQPPPWLDEFPDRCLDNVAPALKAGVPPRLSGSEGGSAKYRGNISCYRRYTFVPDGAGDARTNALSLALAPGHLQPRSNLRRSVKGETTKTEVQAEYIE